MTLLSWETVAVLAAVITLCGVRLCWQKPRHRMSIEERTKDGRLTEAQARRKIAFMSWFGPAITVIGCALLALAIMN